METSTPQPPATNLSTDLYYQLVYTLTDPLPPPLDCSPGGHDEALKIAKVAAEGFKTGDPKADDTNLGPVVSQRRHGRVLQMRTAGSSELRRRGAARGRGR